MIFSRRELLKNSAAAGVLVSSPFVQTMLAWQRRDEQGGTTPRGKKIGDVSFRGELPIDMETVQGSELDGRLYSDLSKLTPEAPVMSTRDFYLRTCASALLENHEDGWTIRMGGLASQPVDFTAERLKSMAGRRGVHLMECAGNTRAFHFGLVSAADWSGVLLSEVLHLVKNKPDGARILISGFDRYQASSATSTPGASWIFTQDELSSAGAFLATEMNGEPLTQDHGAPVRLVMPGWYGCTCIKWVNEISFVSDQAEATSQMLEYFGRVTHQADAPALAREYAPATIESAAIPIRVERWLVDGSIKFRVVGVLWGGSRPVKNLEIRFNPEEDYVPVELEAASGDIWSFWTHWWTPSSAGAYLIRLRVKNPEVPTKRLDSGFYVRSVEIEQADL
jgi:DMSO/TMAO reductase YedYZ molybdopterin-dependent catalytic subunit